jgi:hypothetical protein
MFKLIFTSLIAPFYIVDFPIIWMTDQFVSLITPFRDLAYTICYYAVIDFSADPSKPGYYNPCSSNGNANVVFLAGLIIYLLRILQCIRLGINTKAYFFTPNFWNSIKYLTSLFTLMFSFLYNASDKSLFAGWVVFATISTIYAYCWDIRMDWDLMNPNSKHQLLRDKLAYGNPKFYYLILVVNFLLRLSWAFTLSPNIVASLHVQPIIFTLIIAIL